MDFVLYCAVHLVFSDSIFMLFLSFFFWRHVISLVAGSIRFIRLSYRWHDLSTSLLFVPFL